MTDHDPHPADDTLFDLVDGELDPAAAERVEQHLGRCAACAAFVGLARAGEVDATSARATMPDEAVARLETRLDDMWSKLAGPAPAPELETSPLDPAVQAELSRRARRSRPRRWNPFSHPALVPAMALVLIALVGGSSVYLGEPTRGSDEAPARATGGDSEERATTKRSEAAGGAAPATPTSTEDVPTSSPPEAVTVTPADAVLDGRTQNGAAPTVPPGATNPDEFATEDDRTDPALDTVCVGTFDSSRLYLPDGRAAMQILEGPLGMFIICG